MVAIADFAEILNEQTPLALGSAIALASGAVVVTIWMVRTLTKVDGRFDKLEDKIGQLVTSREFYAWVYKLQKANPNLVLPEDFP